MFVCFLFLLLQAVFVQKKETQYHIKYVKSLFKVYAQLRYQLLAIQLEALIKPWGCWGVPESLLSLFLMT